MILTDEMLQQAVANKEIEIDPFDVKQIQPASYDMRVGNQAVTTSSKELRNLATKGFITFEPGDFGFITTLEKLTMGSQVVGRIGLRSKHARKGLAATTGPQIDHGYRGRLIIGLTNLTPNPVTLSHGEDLLTIEFHKLPSPVRHPYDGPYQDVEGLRPEEIALVTEKKGMLLSEMQSTLSSLSANVGALTREFRILEIAIGFFVALVTGVVVLK